MSNALALQPIVFGETPLSSAYANYVRAPLRAFAVLAIPETVPNYEILRQRRIRAALEQFINEIDSLNSWPKNWDGNNSAKPKMNSIKNAKIWGKEFYALAVKNEYEWRKPFVSADEEGNVVLEWWYKDRNLTLDLSGNEAIFSETRNADSSPKITTGILTHSAIASKLKWLILGA
ncbi:MAG: hypothetical protein INF44_00210 [Thalassospira sp.]|jgi:hypothetical protein|nr:hypothetical protein [Thalassospira sp.]